ncbi:LacI family DNA-binding transcriptional regulator [uncultured Amnibacterium sp.]|uniref:LacI family DNA-binding transcriptional regulator n=1 Tax=uncultured Amnibacterium sp. TaxID=1631851 RepID=UPI0035CBF29A
MGQERARPPSIHDVASRAGVSYQTVSRVLNGAPRIRPDTIERVQRAIGELGYRPNRAARALVTRRTRTIGVLLTAKTLHGPYSSFLAIVDAAAERGYGVTTTPIASDDAAAITDAVEQLLAHGIDGIVAIAPQDRARDALHRIDAHVPVITLQGGPDEVEDFGLDQREAARIAVEHLVALGHRSILHIPGPRGWAESEERERGYRRAMADHGLVAEVTERGDWTVDGGYRVALATLPAGDVSAVFAANDEMAIGAIAAARDLGLDVPGGLSVVGVDDVPVARFVAPALTTVRQDFPLIGRRALDVLIAEIEGDAVPAIHERLPPELVVRRSTAQVTNPSLPTARVSLGEVGGPSIRPRM